MDRQNCAARNITETRMKNNQLMKNHRIVIFFLGLCLSLLSLPSGKAADASTDLKIEIPCQKFVLTNGLTLIVHEDHKAPVVAVNLWYHVGSKNEKPGKTDRKSKR